MSIDIAKIITMGDKSNILFLLFMVGSSVGAQVQPSAIFIDLFARHFSRNAVTVLMPPSGLPWAAQIIKNLR